ncbi:MAG: HD domain-containing protein, partial [Deltaproteobacteria bacterium]
ALRARFRCRDLGDALRIGAISQHDATLLEAAREFVWRARGVLHARAGRRTDRLTFDEQEECARALGFVDPVVEATDPMRAVGVGAERFMQAYYRHARTVATTVERIVEGCRPGRDSRERSPRADRVAEGIERFEGTLTFSDPEALHRDPGLALRVIERSLVLGLPLHARVRDVIAQAAVEPAFCEALRSAAGAGALFRRLIEYSARATLRGRGAPVSATEQGASSVLAEMHDLGLLLAMVPEFGPVTGRVHHDIYHVYTVDVHSVAAVDRLHQVARGEMRDDFAIAARTLADLERRDLVCLATLLHDVGKGRGGDHSAVGAELAAPIARRMGLGDDDAAQVAWLVRNHLALYHFATRRDLTDPATLAQVTTLVGDSWRLRALYLVTVADLSTTSPTAMNSWKARMLDELLRRSEDGLAAATTGITSHVDEMRRRAIAAAPPAERADVEIFLAAMPQRYVLAATAETAVRHARIVRLAHPGEPFVHIAPLDEATADLAEVVVVAPDRSGLLSRLAAMLYVNRLDVQGAQVYSREMGYGVDAVDVFTVRRLENDPGALARLAAKLPRDLAIMLASDEVFDRAMASRAHAGIRRPEPAVRTEVEIDNLASDRFTIIEVFGRDRPGLLYAVASELYALGLSISLSKVNTEGRRVADVFYVSDAGQKVAPARFKEIGARLSAAVEGGG